MERNGRSRADPHPLFTTTLEFAAVTAERPTTSAKRHFIPSGLAPVGGSDLRGGPAAQLGSHRGTARCPDRRGREKPSGNVSEVNSSPLEALI